MIKRLTACVVVMTLVTSLSGCAGMSNQDQGAIAGTALGGLLGSRFGGGSGQVLATAGGALAGAAIGGAIGKNMDKTDERKMQKTLENTPTGQSRAWQNPDTGNRYKVEPIKTYHNDADRPCREYYTEAKIGGETKQIYGKACRKSDGSWKIVK